MPDRNPSASRLAQGIAGLWAGYFFLVWSGLGLPGLSHDYYDQWRQAQLLVLLALWIVAALFLGRHRVLAGVARFTGALLVLPLGWASLALAANGRPWAGLAADPTQRALADLGLWLGLGAALPLLATLLATATRPAGAAPSARAWLDTLGAWMALMPVLGTPSLAFHLYDLLVRHVDGPWHLAFANARHYDDALLPCLLLLWLRPGWLSARRFNGLVLAVSAWYLFGLMLDGARGDLLCLGVALATAAGLNGRRAGSILRTALAAGALAGLGVALVRWLGPPPALVGLVLARADSSGRLTHWRMILEAMRSRPPGAWLTGLGGDGLLAAKAPFNHDPDEVRRWVSLIAHPHNMPIQWLAEWGLVGAALCALALLPLWWLWRRRAALPVLGFGAVLALYVDGLLSGFWIYPQSQMMGLWLVAWMMAARGARQATPPPPSTARPALTRTPAPAWTLLCFTALGLGLSLLLSVHARDLFAAPDYESHGTWPRFWSDGSRLHLPPAGSVPASRPGR